MDRYPDHSKHTAPHADAIPGWARLVLYVVAILAPFAALVAGQLTGEQALAAVVGLFGVIGPAVAIGYQRKQGETEGESYRAGYSAAVREHGISRQRPRPADDERGQ